MVALLLGLGADPSLRDVRFGATPLDWARHARPGRRAVLEVADRRRRPTSAAQGEEGFPDPQQDGAGAGDRQDRVDDVRRRRSAATVATVTTPFAAKRTPDVPAMPDT